jgi:hypothetical protein
MFGFETEAMKRMNWLSTAIVLCKMKPQTCAPATGTLYVAQLEETMSTLRKTIVKSTPQLSFPQARVEVLLAHAEYLAAQAAHALEVTLPRQNKEE